MRAQPFLPANPSYCLCVSCLRQVLAAATLGLEFLVDSQAAVAQEGSYWQAGCLPVDAGLGGDGGEDGFGGYGGGGGKSGSGQGLGARGVLGVPHPLACAFLPLLLLAMQEAANEVGLGACCITASGSGGA